MSDRSHFTICTTASGAPAIRDEALGEVMHPSVGPREEAERLYVAQSRLVEKLATPGPELVLFDVGLGAASNAIAAWRAASSGASQRRLVIVSFERDLAPLALALDPRHARDFGLDGAAGDAARAIRDGGRHESPAVDWRLVRGDLPATLAQSPMRADVVYWDPFSPTGNPDLWTVAAFAALRAATSDRAVVFTYSAATAVRAALCLAGFAVGEGAAIGKKERTTAAAVDLRDLERPLDARFLARLQRSTAPLPRDAPPDAIARVAAAAQFR